MEPDKSRDLGTVAVSAILIVTAAAAIWDTTDMADSDSFVFPRAIAVAMIVFSVALIAWTLARGPMARPGEEEGGPPSTLRRVLLVAAMMVCAGLMPWIGFVLAGMGTFLAIIAIAMHDPWTRFRQVVYPTVGVVVVLGFYALFAKALLVPLPVGTLFE
ncbi:MAG: tripartite tricarboxylate transporter TctB family protein [Hyphomicrobiales bacterium]|nr:tripartite tricarboxylate transporter TctB family protein [Hyphomicrobiales bacterium]MCP5373673.1 tripartite tricarboxylate transporter TctB family protein [Hyphomicrobiales bacterium]